MIANVVVVEVKAAAAAVIGLGDRSRQRSSVEASVEIVHCQANHRLSRGKGGTANVREENCKRRRKS